jgi:RNA polymerase subunit RPABC4/transcription elongation factor Spt4
MEKLCKNCVNFIPPNARVCTPTDKTENCFCPDWSDGNPESAKTE